MSDLPEHATQAGLNISALARRTGVEPDTLRKWERRYDVIRPVRTSGGQRRYSERDVARVEWLRDRLAEGYRIGEAALLLGESGEPAATAPDEARSQLLAAVERSDAGAVGQLLDQALLVSGLEATLAGVVVPLLEDIGDAWAAGRLSVAQEHLATEAIRTRLVRLLADARGAVRGVAVLACPSGERHDVGLLMLGALLRSDGWQVAYLGADTPVDDALALASRLDASLVGFSLVMEDAALGLRRALAATTHSTPAIVVGGRNAEAAAAGSRAVHVRGDLRQSVETLRRFAA
jgi:MerR family transcriptional regulator, light-induced transcriptional regulator